MKSRCVPFVLAVLLAAASGCATVRQFPIGGGPGPGPSAGDPPDMEIVGYTTADGVHHRFAGFVRLAAADSVHFLTPADALVPGGRYPFLRKVASRQVSFALARADVASVSVERTKTLATIAVIALASLALFTGIVVAAGGFDLSMPSLGQVVTVPVALRALPGRDRAPDRSPR